MRPRQIIGAALAAMVLVGGCTVKPVPTTTFDTTPATTGSSATSPVKYASASFRSCAEIQQKVPGLPPALAAEPIRGAGRFSLTCTFTTSKNDDTPMITLDVELYENQQDSSGAERAKAGFNSLPVVGEKDTSVNLGSEARWKDPGVGSSCRLQVLDENVVMMTTYNRGTKLDPRGEECRRAAREVVEQLYEAVQP